MWFLSTFLEAIVLFKKKGGKTKFWDDHKKHVSTRIVFNSGASWQCVRVSVWCVEVMWEVSLAGAMHVVVYNWHPPSWICKYSTLAIVCIGQLHCISFSRHSVAFRWNNNSRQRVYPLNSTKVALELTMDQFNNLTLYCGKIFRNNLFFILWEEKHIELDGNCFISVCTGCLFVLRRDILVQVTLCVPQGTGCRNSNEPSTCLLHLFCSLSLSLSISLSLFESVAHAFLWPY